jgi:heme/copper-type cytochrome/quinol oxidase subunit 3
MSTSTLRTHLFHIVDPSPWPFFLSIGAGIPIPVGAVMYMHNEPFGGWLLILGFMVLAIIAGLWWFDVIIEGTFQGMHTSVVQSGLRLGVILFILSEVMFFASFFWAFFHSSLAPAIQIGSIWPPRGILTFSPWGVPLLNTFILLTSGVTVTAAHHYLLNGLTRETSNSLILTVLLAITFTALQVFEYVEAPFNISDGIYGSIFFMATGFHGFHVIVGTAFLTIVLLRVLKSHFSTTHHIGFEAAAWYWHFVDVVWLFLFVVVYWWGGK